MKVAIIGAGSIGFTRGLIRDTLAVPEFAETTFALTDINARNLDMIAQLARRDIAGHGLPAAVTATTERRRALAEADYVFNVTRIGGLEAFRMDVDIPLKYGVDQCVGDTLCIGGILYGQRNAPCILDFCRDMREVSKPGATLISHANPMAINTWVAVQYGRVPFIGLCHGVEGGHRQIADVIERLINRGRRPDGPRYRKVGVRDVDIICAGINHQTWYIQVRFDGEDWTGRLLKGFEQHPVYRRTEKVRIDMMRRFGYFTTESNGHCSEYVPWYRKRPRDIPRWIGMDSWIHGETGGYLRVCTEGREWFKHDFPQWLKEPPAPIGPEHRGAEHGSYIMEALETGRVYRGHFNVPNRGCITNLPDDAIVEVPVYVDRNGLSVPRVGDLPLGCAGVLNASISVQRLAVEAAVQGDVTLLKQAALLDPLTGAVCDPHEISQMVDEMLVAQARWLPQYRAAMPGARRRLRTEKRLGVRRTRGAARRQARGVAEMRREAATARRLSQAADKAG